MPLILELEKAYGDAKADPAFQAELDGYLTIMSAGRARSISPSA
jgi:tryptophan synthase beta subunit